MFDVGMNIQCIHGGQERVGMCIPQHTCGDQKTVSSVDPCCPGCLRLGLSAVYCCLGRLSWPVRYRDSPVSASDLTADSYQCTWFGIGPGHLKSSIHVHAANS